MGCQAQQSLWHEKYTIKSKSNAFHNLTFWPQPTPWGFTKKNVLEMGDLGSGRLIDAFIPIMPTIAAGANWLRVSHHRLSLPFSKATPSSRNTNGR